MTDLSSIMPIKGETWRHNKSGNEYRITGSCLNVITDKLEVLYEPLEQGDFLFFTRQLRGHPKAWMTKNENGTPRFTKVS